MLEGRPTSQIVGNSNAILNLSNFFEIDAELAEILPLEVDRVITKFLGSNGRLVFPILASNCYLVCCSAFLHLQ